jgi:ribosomal protein S27E
MVGADGFRMETVDEVLRDLLTCGLVFRGTSDDGQSWLLDTRAQQRLGHLAFAVGPWPVERTTYMNRQCADCRSRKLVWVRKDSNLCDSCSQQFLAFTRAEPTSTRSTTPRFPRGQQLITGNEFPDSSLGEPTEHPCNHLARRQVTADSQS